MKALFFLVMIVMASSSTTKSINSPITVKHYRLAVNIQDRYVRSEVAVHVLNNSTAPGIYDFGVKLGENEFISSLTLRVGDRVTAGRVYKKKKAEKIFNEAQKAGENTAITSQSEKKDTSFNTKISIPANESAFVWLVYEEQLERTKSVYEYKSQVMTYTQVEKFELYVNIKESRDILYANVQFANKDEEKLEHVLKSPKERSFNKTTENEEITGSIQIKYDVQRPSLMGGDIIIRNGYFVHFISPENLDPIPKNIIFVIDRSGSMRRQKMERTKEAFEIILEDLKNDEKFNVIAFDNQIDLFAPQAQEAEKKSAAIEFVQGLYARGGTAIDEALKRAFDETADDKSANVIMFLSDGQPSYKTWNEIQENAKRRNQNRFAIFSLAIGSGASFSEMEKLSTSNNGIARQVYSDSELVDNLEGFYRSVAEPLIWKFNADYSNVKKKIMSDKKLFKGGELVIVGELDDPCEKPEVAIDSVRDDELNDVLIISDKSCSTSTTTSGSSSTDLMDNPNQSSSEIDLEKMFAYMQIRLWMRELKGAIDSEREKALIKDITDQSIKYGFVTKYTSMVVRETPLEPEITTTSPPLTRPHPYGRFTAHRRPVTTRPAMRMTYNRSKPSSVVYSRLGNTHRRGKYRSSNRRGTLHRIIWRPLSASKAHDPIKASMARGGKRRMRTRVRSRPYSGRGMSTGVSSTTSTTTSTTTTTTTTTTSTTSTTTLPEACFEISDDVTNAIIKLLSSGHRFCVNTGSLPVPMGKALFSLRNKSGAEMTQDQSCAIKPVDGSTGSNFKLEKRDRFGSQILVFAAQGLCSPQSLFLENGKLFLSYPRIDDPMEISQITVVS